MWLFSKTVSSRWKKIFLYHLVDFLVHSRKPVIMSALSTAPIFLLYSSTQTGFILACPVMWSSFPVAAIPVGWTVVRTWTSLLSCYLTANCDPFSLSSTLPFVILQANVGIPLRFAHTVPQAPVPRDKVLEKCGTTVPVIHIKDMTLSEVRS